ncbi:MAG: ACP S-malonyltransferase [Clostridiales bacterium]|nr:ACP S-malonyltransferase [Clostridiales bacterium]
MKIAFVYPGQGAQKNGMMQDFYENCDKAKEMFDTASKISGYDIADLCFNEKEELNQTKYTQVCLLTACMAATEVLEEEGIKPDATCGLSLGEYTALVASDAVRFDEAVRLVTERGKIMEEAAPDIGGMSAVIGMDEENLRSAIQGIDGVYVANFNCPGQIVITGYKEAVEKAGEALKENGAKRVIPLKCSGPFHSPIMADAGHKLRKYIDELHLEDLSAPYAANLTGDLVTDKNQIPELLEKQVSGSVRMQQDLESLARNGVDTFIEIGPGKTISGFVKKTLEGVNILNVETLDDVKTVVSKVKELAEAAQ